MEVLGQLDLPATVKDLQKELAKTSSKLKKKKIMYKIRTLNGMIGEEIDPSWVVLRNVPVFRLIFVPWFSSPAAVFATSDLNDLCRFNKPQQPSQKLIKLSAPEIILRNEKRMLQESVDILIDAQKVPKNKRKNNVKRLPLFPSDLLRSKKAVFAAIF